MLDGSTFDKIEELARRLRPECADEPFGGIQLVFCGDFLQLPPVGMERDSSVRFLFEARSWSRCFEPDHCITLQQCFRQKDAQFITLLNELRVAKLSPFSIALLQHAVANPPAMVRVWLHSPDMTAPGSAVG